MAILQRLCREWQTIVTNQHTLRKTFVSVKGIYYQVDSRLETLALALMTTSTHPWHLILTSSRQPHPPPG